MAISLNKTELSSYWLRTNISNGKFRYSISNSVHCTIGWSDFQFFRILKIATFRWILVGILGLI